MRNWIVWVILVMLWAGMGVHPQGLSCPPAYTEKQQQDLISYVRKRYKLTDTIALTLKNATAIGDSCFRKLAFEGKSGVKTWELVLYASPDARFLTTELFDTKIDPVLERRAKDEEIMKGLVRGAIASRGPTDATVTLVEFSDFECPYCKKFAQTLDEALSTGGNDVRIVFHHMPLSNHPWARMAAEEAGCAELQSNDAFWSLHDKIFQNQDVVTADNAKEKLGEFSKGIKGLDGLAVQKCMDTGMSVGLVLKDIEVAETYHVNGTPTVFINGQRIQSVESAAQLREIIAAARRESTNSVSINGTFAH